MVSISKCIVPTHCSLLLTAVHCSFCGHHLVSSVAFTLELYELQVTFKRRLTLQLGIIIFPTLCSPNRRSNVCFLFG